MQTVAFPTEVPIFRPGQWRVLPPRAGLVAQLANDAGVVLPLHNPDADHDARRLAALVADACDVVVIGLYPVALLDVLQERDDRRVLVLEPDAEWAERVRTSPEGRRALATGRVTIHALGDAHDALWRHFVDPTRDPAVLMHPVLRKAWPEAVGAAQLVAQRAFSGASANFEARRTLAPRYLAHTLANVGRVAAGIDVRQIAGRWTGRPAVLLGAGPSLDEVLPMLRAKQDHVVVIATDTAVRPCLAAGIAPHFCVGVDPSPANGRHLSDLVIPERTWLCAEASLQPEALRPFGDRLVVFRVADHDPWPWLSTIGLGRSPLRAWGSVLTTAFDLAILIGASPIVFAGADLAYTDGRPYCNGTTYDGDWAALRADGVPQETIARSFIRQPVQLADVHGRQTVSAPHLIAFRDWIVEQSTKLGTGRVLNATGAGILHGPGIVQTSLAAILDGCTTRVPDVAEALGRPPGGDVRTLTAAVGELLWGLRDGSEPAAALVDRWTAFAGGQVTRAAIHDTLVGVVHEHHLPRQPVVERRDDAPMAQDDEELLEAFDWMRGIGDVGVYVEIGSRFGGSLHAMARQLGRDVTFIAIDLPDGPWGHPDAPAALARVAADLRDEGYDVHVIAGDSHAAETRLTLEHLLAGRAIDVLLLDGDRTTAGILSDAKDYGAFVRHGGLVLLHDIAAEPGPRGRPRAALTEQSRAALDAGDAAWVVLSDAGRARRTVHAYGLGGVTWRR